MADPVSGRLRRLADDLEESGLRLDGTDALRATIVQRHPAGLVRIVGSFGVLRWKGYSWHHEPPVSSWIDSVITCPTHGDAEVLQAMLEFAVHDLGSMGIGALLIYRPDDDRGPP